MTFSKIYIDISFTVILFIVLHLNRSLSILSEMHTVGTIQPVTLYFIKRPLFAESQGHSDSVSCWLLLAV